MKSAKHILLGEMLAAAVIAAAPATWAQQINGTPEGLASSMGVQAFQVTLTN